MLVGGKLTPKSVGKSEDRALEDIDRAIALGYKENWVMRLREEVRRKMK
jgi:hypothetical protein